MSYNPDPIWRGSARMPGIRLCALLPARRVRVEAVQERVLPRHLRQTLMGKLTGRRRMIPIHPAVSFISVREHGLTHQHGCTTSIHS